MAQTAVSMLNPYAVQCTPFVSQGVIVKHTVGIIHIVLVPADCEHHRRHEAGDEHNSMRAARAFESKQHD